MFHMFDVKYGRTFWNCWSSEMMRYDKMICFKDDSILCLCFYVFVINTGCAGPDLVNILEVPKIMQRVLESIRNHQLAILGIIKTPKLPYNIIKNQENKKRLKYVPHFPPLEPHWSHGHVSLVLSYFSYAPEIGFGAGSAETGNH